MKYYFYRTTNLINGKYYLGVHHSKNPEKDPYFGSGPGIVAAVKKYGRENFKVEVLKDDFQSMDEAYAYEASVVTLESLNPQVCYNQVPGGRGIKDGVICMSKGDEEIRVHKSLQPYYETKGYVRGRSQKARENVSISHKGKPSRQKGRTYLHRGYDEEIRVEKDQVQFYLDRGYKLGHSQASKDRTSRGRKGYLWANNGTVTIQVKDYSKLPEGFVPGRLGCTEQTKQLLRVAHLGCVDSLESREKKRRAKKGRSWTLVDGKRVWSPRLDK